MLSVLLSLGYRRVFLLIFFYYYTLYSRCWKEYLFRKKDLVAFLNSMQKANLLIWYIWELCICFRTLHFFHPKYYRLQIHIIYRTIYLIREDLQLFPLLASMIKMVKPAFFLDDCIIHENKSWFCGFFTRSSHMPVTIFNIQRILQKTLTIASTLPSYFHDSVWDWLLIKSLLLELVMWMKSLRKSTPATMITNFIACYNNPNE